MRLTLSSSTELLATAQTASGALPASTADDLYRYGWLSDGSRCAYALDRAGHTEAVSAWRHRIARTLLAHPSHFDDAVAAGREGRVNGQVMMTADGSVRRYLGDTFYGGSEWILLAATLGWVSYAMHVVLCDEPGRVGA